MESLPAAHSIGDVGGGRGIPTAGEDPEEPSGPETGCLSQILGLRLGNRGNFCYSNAVVRSWLHLAAWLGGLQQLFEGNMLAHLKGLMQAKGVIHMWSNPFWRAQMGKWRNPHKQHDVAEFLTHALSRLPSAMIRLATPWQVRTRGTFWRVQDQGPSVPLVIQPSELAGTESLGMQTVQGMIEAWHNQKDVHALEFWPSAIVLQAGRFDFNAGCNRAIKRRYTIEPCTEVLVPGFQHGRGIQWKRYQLCSIIIHLGDSPSSGHYFNIFYDTGDSSYSIADDGVASRSRDASELIKLSSDMYLFFYCKSR